MTPIPILGERELGFRTDDIIEVLSRYCG